jgi:hypothetical protein
LGFRFEHSIEIAGREYMTYKPCFKNLGNGQNSAAFAQLLINDHKVRRVQRRCRHCFGLIARQCANLMAHNEKYLRKVHRNNLVVFSNEDS